MNFCAQSPNATIGNTNITWAQAESNALNNLTTALRPSYLRPDTAGALLPWIYTIVILIVHIPVVFIRVARWEAIQYWCLVSTFFTVVIYTQAYISTRFDVAKVLTWTPLILVIDAGSMLQVIFLIIEAKKESVEEKVERKLESQELFNLLPDPPAFRAQTKVVQRPSTDDPRGDIIRPDGKIAPRGFFSSSKACTANGNCCWYRNPLNYVAVVAALLLIAILVLQLLGLVKATQAAKASPNPPLVSWCSPFFQPFGIAAIDGCDVYHISQSLHKGIGCITIPGQWQQQWLKGTIAGISIELCLESVDLLILSLVNGRRKISRRSS